MENCNLILGILIISAMLYIIILNNPTKEHYNRYNNAKPVKICAPHRSILTLGTAMLLKNKKKNGDSCLADIDCDSVYCHNYSYCRDRCVYKTGLSNLSGFSRRY
jgi:hypothetical protein